MLGWLIHRMMNDDGEASPSRTILASVILSCLAMVGLLSIFVASFSVASGGQTAEPHLVFRNQFFSIGLLAAISGSGAGALLGLLFGLPTSAARAAAAKQGDPWFNDNTAMEQIADWLTKIIVGLSLANFGLFMERGVQVSLALSIAMTANPAAEPAIGAVILSSSALVGFITSYIWIRRYLPAELTAARQDMLARQLRQAEAEQIRAINDAGNQQKAMDRSAMSAALRTETGPNAKSEEGLPERISEGEDDDDPWKGKFQWTGASTVVLTATVTPLSTRSKTFVLRIKATALPDQIKNVAGKKARLYLHPTFERFVRKITFDASGGYELELLAWGAFTIGLQMASGELHELDLSQIPDAPQSFKSS